MENIIPLFDTDSGESFRQKNGRLFVSDLSLRWFFRSHKRELVERGAVVLLNGRWCAVEPLMDEAVLEIARRAATRAVQGEP
jgi:hypothetical protein